MASTAKNRKTKNRFVGTQIWEAQEEDILRGLTLSLSCLRFNWPATKPLLHTAAFETSVSIVGAWPGTRLELLFSSDYPALSSVYSVGIMYVAI